jgi:Phosphomannomutase
MSNLGLEHALNEMNIPFQRAAVGDRYVMELLEKTIGHWVENHRGTLFY